MKIDWRDYATRAALLIAGVAAAATFVMRGDIEPLPFLALGGALGATLVSGRAERSERD